MYLKRIADSALLDIISGHKVGFILGARQVGKTTLVEHIVRDRGAVFLNFDVEVDKARFRAAADLGGLIEKSYPLVTAVLFAFPICFTTKDTKDTKSTKRLDNEALDPVL